MGAIGLQVGHAAGSSVALDHEKGVMAAAIDLSDQISKLEHRRLVDDSAC